MIRAPLHLGQGRRGIIFALQSLGFAFNSYLKLQPTLRGFLRKDWRRLINNKLETKEGTSGLIINTDVDVSLNIASLKMEAHDPLLIGLQLIWR